MLKPLSLMAQCLADAAAGLRLTGVTRLAGGGLTGGPVFMQRHAGAGPFRRAGGQQQQQVEAEEAVAFKVMLRRGGREDKTKAVQVSCCMLPLQGAALSHDCAWLHTLHTTESKALSKEVHGSQWHQN